MAFTSMYDFAVPATATTYSDLLSTSTLTSSTSAVVGLHDQQLDSLGVTFDDQDGDELVTSGSSIFDIGTESMFWALTFRLIKLPSATSDIFAKRAGANGYQLSVTTAGVLQWIVGGTSTQTETVSIANYVGERLVLGCRYDVTANLHRLYVWRRGDVTSSTGTTAALGSLTNAVTWSLGDGPNLSANFSTSWLGYANASGAEGIDNTNIASLATSIFGI